MLDTAVPGQRFFAPEVVQTSAMDCGPAALKSLLDGFNIPVSYGRLREACQTDVDGTSINTIEDIAIQLGLRAEQVMLPVDHLALPEAQALPAILVVQRPSGMTHFLVIWGQVGRFLQVMDPATGRRWPTWKRLRNEVYVHTFPVPTAAWREWAGSEGLSAPLRRRLLNLRIEPAQADRLIEEAAADPGWRPLATLDAAVRMTTALVDSKGITAGAQAGKVLERFYRLNLEGPLPKVDKSALAAGETQTAPGLMIPAAYWSVLPYIQNEEELSGAAPPEMLLLRGAVMVRILGVRDGAAAAVGESPAAAAPLSPDLQAALKEPSSQLVWFQPSACWLCWPAWLPLSSRPTPLWRWSAIPCAASLAAAEGVVAAAEVEAVGANRRPMTIRSAVAAEGEAAEAAPQPGTRRSSPRTSNAPRLIP